MKAIVDTNVIAYYLLGTPQFADEVRGFWHKATELSAPALWEAETANVVWMAIRSGVLSAEDGRKRLELAARLGVRSVASRTLWQGALGRAVSSGVAVYDTLFVELALRERLPLVTFDKKVLRAFPETAKRPGQTV